MIDFNIFFLAPVVFVAGFIDSIAGGGGLLTVPAYLIAGIPPTLTLGTNKLVSSIGTVVSSTKYILSGRILWPVVIVGIPLTLLGSAIGAHNVAILDQELVRKIILITLPIAALLTLIPKPKVDHTVSIHWRSPKLWYLVPFIAFGMGFYDGIFGPGTGSLLLLAFYGLTKISFLRAAATARIFNLTSNIGALITFLVHGQVLIPLALILGVFGIAGHYCGSHMAIKKGDGLVRGMLAISCSLLFGYLCWEHFIK